MNKKSNVKKTAALLLGIALAVGSVGCSNFVITDNEKDLAQTVATVNISESLKEDAEYSAVASQLGEIVGNLSTDISKRDLVAYFLSTGYQYVQSYGYTYEATFNMLMDGLVSREIMIQYAIAYYLKNNTDVTAAGCKAYIEAQLAAASEKEQALLKAHPEVLTLKYFLTDGGKDTAMEDYDRAVYSLKKSLNDTLDTLEKERITAEDEEHDHEEARTLPTGVDTEKEDYYTKDYEVYTGRNTLDDCGEYEKVDGSTTSTRKKAYNAFLANLQGYNMISTAGEVENTSKITELKYFYVELSSVLGQSLINKYFEDLEDSVTAELDAEYMQTKYEDMYNAQKTSYQHSPTAFATAMDSVSDTSFLLYGLKDFGFVYNILIPFSTSQNIAYTTAKNNKANTQDDLYNIRKDILNGVQGKDLRGSWISEHDHANYSYTEGEGDSKVYKFFKENVAGSTKYEKLKQYAGNYAFNGKVTETDGELEISTKGYEVSIDDFISLMASQINLAVGEEVAPAYNPSTDVNAAYEKDSKTTVYTNAEDEVEYSKFVYYQGKANLGEVKAKDYFNADSKVYKAVSAVNELMFAYSTDTGCLNTYFGYAVSPYKTNFVKEFEYAAQEAVKGGVGSYVVCATDYGWHIVFASYVFSADGNVFDMDGNADTIDGYNHEEKDVEGTFSNLFYESMKSAASKNYTTAIQNGTLNKYNNEDSVKRFESRYKDLMQLDK